MSVNKIIIDTFSLDQKKEFLSVLKKKNRRGDVKNIELFLMLSNGIEDKSIDIKLYGVSNKGAYHAISKRLHDSLIEFIASDSFSKGNSKEAVITKLLEASKYFFLCKQNELAFKTLKKAELKAQKHDFFQLLHEIYLLKIQHLHKSKLYDFVAVKNAFEKNKLQLQLQENLQMFYATIQYELENTSKDPIEVLESNLEKFAITSSRGLHFVALIKIIEVFNTVAHVSSKHIELWTFVENTMADINKKDIDIERYLPEKIQLLFYLANFNFRIKKMDVANTYLKAMDSHMRLKKGVYFNHFVLKYKLLKVLTALFSGELEHALITLDDCPKEVSRTEEYYDLLLSKVVVLFFKGNIEEAYRIYSKFYHSDVWYTQKVGTLWVVQKNLIELLLLLELDSYDLFQARLVSFRKKHKYLLVHHNETRVLEFVKLITVYYKDNTCVEKDSFKKKVNELVKDDTKTEDVFILCFYAWLKAKIDKKELYSACLELLQ
ncbi:hypothetical protein [Flavicella marina]|uniref:hypothetical protein n=1 Tax=Flavicella marina TaxID=1475951 RepID=UPI001263F6C1|nr:hypothetical protein [Flavicella marina]